MKNVCGGVLNLRRGAVRLAMTLTLLTGLGTVAAWGQAPPYALMQDSTLTGTGNTINVTQLPLVLSTGIIYVDLTILFDVAADGTLTVAPGYPIQVPAPHTLDDGFMAGNYSATTTGSAIVTVSGPGVAPSGATIWSLSPYGTACANPDSATWYDVGLAIKTSPIYSRLKAAGITSTQFYQFGVNGSGGCNNTSTWQSDGLLGFSQAGNTITISSFTNSGKDQSTPAATTTFTKAAQ